VLKAKAAQNAAPHIQSGLSGLSTCPSLNTMCSGLAVSRLSSQKNPRDRQTIAG